jgi:hypothetical protein
VHLVGYFHRIFILLLRTIVLFCQLCVILSSSHKKREHSQVICPWNILYLFPCVKSPSEPRPPNCWDFEITFRHVTFGRTSLDEWSGGRRNFNMTLHDIQKRQTDIHNPGEIRTRNPSKRAVADPCLRPRGIQNRQKNYIPSLFHYMYFTRFQVMRSVIILTFLLFGLVININTELMESYRF